MATLLVTINGVDYEPAPEQPMRSQTPQSGFFAITASAASTWLRGNHNNRSLSEEASAAQGRDMSTTDWDVNGETLILSRPLREGEMEGVPAGTVAVLDGQHRLEACARSGKTFVSNVSWGIDPAARRSIDSGRGRSIRDVLGMDGEKYVGAMGTLLRRQALWNEGQRKFTGGRKAVTNAEMLHLLNSDPHAFRRAVQLATHVTGRPDGFHLAPTVAVAQGIYLTRQVDLDVSVWFFERLRDGVGLEAGSPLLAVRKRFQNDATNAGGNGRRRVATHQPLGYLIVAWNAHRTGEEMTKIQFPPEKSIPDPK